MSGRDRLLGRSAFCAVLVAFALVGNVSSAFALSPWWHLFSGTRPGSLRHLGLPGRPDGQIVVTLANLGDAAVVGESGDPVRIVDRLPAGFQATSVLKISGASLEVDGKVECVLEQSGTVVACTFVHQLPPYQQIELVIGVMVPEEPVPGVNNVSVSGGGAAPASITRPVSIGNEPAFGVEDYEVSTEEEGGTSDALAGSHPFQTTFTLAFDQSLQESIGPGGLEGQPEPFVQELPKDVYVELPPGMVGDPTAIPRCPLSQFLAKTPTCSPKTIVGVAMVTINEASRAFPLSTFSAPVFNLQPQAGAFERPLTGEPARFGFSVAQVPVFLDTGLRSNGDYGVTTKVENITQTSAFLSNKVTIWGVPGDPRHDSSRGVLCVEHGVECSKAEEKDPPPFFALPTSCSGAPLASDVLVDSWTHPGAFERVTPLTPLPVLDGCNRLPFSSEIVTEPEGTVASTPTGLSVDVHVPQEEALNPNGLMPAQVKNITVALPEGLALNPSGGDGLQACSEAQVGYLGLTEPVPGSGFPGGVNTFNEKPVYPELEEPGVNTCPGASKIGTVKVSTPLLPKGEDLTGGVYLATQNENPFGSLIAMYIIARDPISGASVKLPGEVRLTETGQIISTFKDTPQLPFEDAELRFFGGQRAPLASPSRCGSYTTTATIYPWSGNQPVTSNSTFAINSGPNATPCTSRGQALPFAPSLTAGMTNINAGSFSQFTNTIARADGNQNMQSVSLHIPPGLSGLLSGVTLCPEPQANEGSCSQNSLIGETIVSAGVGTDPVSVKGGKVYITGPYNGTGACSVGTPGCAPFGLSIVNPVKAGPFDLEHDTSKLATNMPACDCVIVRAKLEVDPITAALTVTTDPSGPYAIPHMIDGIPVQIQKVNVLINKPGFTFNPTNCDQTTITGAINSDEGSSSPVSVPFDVANCATLGFKPGFQASVTGKTSRQTGAGLHVLLTYPKAPFGTQANIGSVKVDLPRQLPSNLKTLQHACPHQIFEANPATCPQGSIVGHAKAITPLLPVPLEGPAYFVSYGGLKFPELVIVLQGYGVTIDLHGETYIDEHTGITSSTFHTIPDQPVGSFELTLPQGPNSALDANTNLCKITITRLVRKKVTARINGRTRTVTRKVKQQVPAPLLMPTLFVAQNGATFKQNTPIEVTDCAKTHPNTKGAGAKRRGGKGARKG